MNETNQDSLLSVETARQREGEGRFAEAAELFRSWNQFEDAARCEASHQECLRMANDK